MPSISYPRYAPELSHYEATILGLANCIGGSLSSAADALTPPEEKQIVLRDGIEFGHSTLSHMSGLMSELLAKVRTFQDGYDKLQSSMNLATNTLSSPISSLPDEILIEIMLYCSPADGFARIMYGRRPWYASIFVMVSRKWRALVYSSPGLWSSFAIQLIPVDLRHEIGPISRIVDRHLTYSIPSPLTLHLAEFLYYPDDIARQLFAHSERWEHLTLSRGVIPDVLREMCSYRFPKLRSLELEYCFSMADGPFTAFDDASELQFLTLHDRSSELLSPDFPWHQLTSLTFDQYDRHDPHTITILSQVRNIINLTLKMTKKDVHPPEPNRALPPYLHLRRLFITTAWSPILDYLSAPSLEQLYLRGESLCGPAINLLRRSACRLTELTMVVDRDPSAIKNILAACPSLIVLSIQTDYRSITELYILLNDLTFIPHLRSLTLVYSGVEVLWAPLLSDPTLCLWRPFQSWMPSKSVPSSRFGPPRGRLPSDHLRHATALRTAIRTRLTSLRSVSISNPITKWIVLTLLSFARQGINVKILIGSLPE